MAVNNTSQRFFIIISFFIVALLYSCGGGFALSNTQHAKSNVINTYKGWWIYGDGEHIFKDEKTLKEYNLIFESENIENITNLYLDICETEYFPMESIMIGYIINNSIKSGQNALVASDFEILYIEGCGE